MEKPFRAYTNGLRHFLPCCFVALLALVACVPDLDPVDQDRTFSHIEELVVSIGPRPHDSQGNLLTRDYILQTFLDYGLQDPHYHAFSDPSVQDGANVVATAPGTTYPEYIFVVGAHYDSIPNGVGSVDNATGVASMLEVAQYFSQNEPAYTLRFVAFDAEEIGLVGSEHYYQDHLDELDDTLLMLCLDMTQSNESSPQAPLVAFVLSANQAMADTFGEVKLSMGFAGIFEFSISVELAEQVTGGPLRTDIRHWRDDPLLLAWPWAVAGDYHTVPGSIDETDRTGLAISTKFILEFLRGLQEYPPEALRVTAGVAQAVDQEFVRLLLDKGGIKPVH